MESPPSPAGRQPAPRWIRLRAWWAERCARTSRAPDGTGEVRETRWRGHRLERVRFERGRKHGPAEAWWPHGAKRSHGQHVDDARDGDWFFFEPDGSLDRARTGLYRQGQRIAGIRGFNDWLGSP